MDATTTPTPLSHDEYELPREVRTVRVNRLKARRAMASDDNAMKRKHSVFSQLQREMRGWSGATLRRGFVAKGHGGQRRAYKVKLVGEGCNDYGGAALLHLLCCIRFDVVAFLGPLRTNSLLVVKLIITIVSSLHPFRRPIQGGIL